MPDSARSVPVVMVSGWPDCARNTPDTLQSDASMRAAVLLNSGVSIARGEIEDVLAPSIAAPLVDLVSLPCCFGLRRGIEHRHRPRVARGDVERALALADQPLAPRDRVVGARGESARQPALDRELQPLVVLPALIGDVVHIPVVLPDRGVIEADLTPLLGGRGAVGERLRAAARQRGRAGGRRRRACSW